jgi:hypothetical protein
MKVRLFSVIALSTAISYPALAQQGPPSPDGQFQPGGGQRGMGGFMGRGVTGTVTDAAADHFTVKTMTGEIYTVHYSANTRFMKQAAGARGQGGQTGGQGDNPGQWRRQRDNQGGAQAGQGNGQGRMMMGGGGQPQPIKSSDIKVGDAIAVMGEVDSSAKSVGAVGVVQLDPERAKQMQEMEANYGKTWLMGKVTEINETQVTLQGSIDNAPHTFVADENTTLRERRDPITLADIHVGDVVRAEGSLKGDAFTATAVTVMTAPAAATRAPRNGAPPSQQ